MKKLYFIRHGLTELNKAGLYAGHTETPLTAEGRAQAKAAADLIKPLDIDMIVSSPLERAVETAQIIAAEIGYPADKILINKFLIERFFGELEGKPYDPDYDVDLAEGAEDFSSLLKRANAAIHWLENLDANNMLVVSHGGFGRALRELHLPDIERSVHLKNCEVIQLK